MEPSPQFNTDPAQPSSLTAFRPVTESPETMYAPARDGNFAIAGVDAARMNPDHVRQVVDYPTREAPGTIVVDQTSRYLYFILPRGKAIRYAVGVGPIARAFPGGEAEIARKAAWPRWIPTPSMIERSPGQYARYADGVDGGPGNPMGARALYMHQDGVDTYYRVHGTNDPSSIGRSVSAGCIRLLNQDIIDLHDRVQPGAKIVVL
ncbi:L,D-transpeptidase [Pannonibacter phragmitetus]|uniref:L,D-transpeptidase n=1 Tax=Pannonibacter phragmitetus TaxID=121719 RepID=UPI000B97BCF3|nr:L,D-transpeptidase [Pannonibacter phragmitetus]